MYRFLRYFLFASYLILAAFASSDQRSGKVKVPEKILEEIPKPGMFLPKRSPWALTGSEIAKKSACLSHSKREQFIYNQFVQGNVPSFMRDMEQIDFSVEIQNKKYDVVFFVSSDYLSLGSDVDFIRVPVDFGTAIKLSKRFNLAIPTKKMVDIIFSKSPCKIAPKPFPPGKSMVTDKVFKKHNDVVTEQVKNLPDTMIKSGQKKDIVLSKKLLQRQNRIAIYGWHRPNGKAIQPVSTVHHAGYVDYSHGLQLISSLAVVNKKIMSITKLLADPVLSILFSDEGTMEVDRILRTCNK